MAIWIILVSSKHLSTSSSFFFFLLLVQRPADAFVLSLACGQWLLSWEYWSSLVCNGSTPVNCCRWKANFGKSFNSPIGNTTTGCLSWCAHLRRANMDIPTLPLALASHVLMNCVIICVHYQPMTMILNGQRLSSFNGFVR